jgi:hypothetical protein
MKFYAGIGSRETPSHILQVMSEDAYRLQARGYILRSGAAEGADSAFEAGAGDQKEIWLPWRGFQNHPSRLLPSLAAFEMAARFHPAWERCSRGARALHARNCHQVLGADLATPVEFVLCWTKDGRASGGTGQAIRIAEAHGIPVRYY